MLLNSKDLGIILILLLTWSEVRCADAQPLKVNPPMPWLASYKTTEIKYLALLLGGLEESGIPIVSQAAGLALTKLRDTPVSKGGHCNFKEMKEQYKRSINVQTGVFRNIPAEYLAVISIWAYQFNSLEEMKHTRNLREFCENLKLSMKEHFLRIKKLDVIEDDQEYQSVNNFECQKLPAGPLIVDHSSSGVVMHLQASFDTMIYMIDCINSHGIYSKIYVVSALLSTYIINSNAYVSEKTYALLMTIWHYLKTSYYITMINYHRDETFKLSEYVGKLIARLI